MSSPVASNEPDPAWGEGGVLAAEVPCDACRYNLRGLTRLSSCPECGRQVVLAVEQWRWLLGVGSASRVLGWLLPALAFAPGLALGLSIAYRPFLDRAFETLGCLLLILPAGAMIGCVSLPSFAPLRAKPAVAREAMRLRLWMPLALLVLALGWGFPESKGGFGFYDISFLRSFARWVCLLLSLGIYFRAVGLAGALLAALGLASWSRVTLWGLAITLALDMGFALSMPAAKLGWVGAGVVFTLFYAGLAATVVLFPLTILAAGLSVRRLARR